MIRQYKKEGKVYYLIQLSYTDKTGKRHQPKYRKDINGQLITSNRMAKALEYEYLNTLKAEIEGDYSSLSFRDWHKKFVEEIKITFKRSTVHLYDTSLMKWLTKDFLDKKLSDFKKADIHEFIFEHLANRGASLHTQKKMRKTIRRIFEAALEEGLISRNPANGISIKVPPPKKLVLNTKEVDSLLTEGKEVNHPFYFHWAMALLTGMRNGELYSLRWKHVDEVSGLISINSQWTNKDGLHSTKSNKDRVFPISKELQKLLLELKNLGPFTEELKSLNGNDGIFTDFVMPRSSEWKHGEQARVLKKFCNQIGITEIKFHDLRATFITNMLTQGVSLPKVMALVGHSRTSTTDEYLRLAGVNTRGATDQLGYSLPKVKENNLLGLFKS